MDSKGQLGSDTVFKSYHTTHIYSSGIPRYIIVKLFCRLLLCRHASQVKRCPSPWRAALVIATPSQDDDDVNRKISTPGGSRACTQMSIHRDADPTARHAA